MTNAQTEADLRALRDLIVSSIDSYIEHQFGAKQNGTNGVHGTNGHTNGSLNGHSQTSAPNGTAYKRNGATPHKESQELPSRQAFNEQRILLAAAGKLTELVSDPSVRLFEASSQYFESRCLHIAADKRIADILDASHNGALHVETLATKVGIEPKKLARVMRVLCSIHIFTESEPNTFANNRISAALIHNEPMRAYIMLFGMDLYSSADELPKYLSDPEAGPSYAVENTPFQFAANTTKPRWEWLEEKVTVKSLKEGNCGSDETACTYPGPFGTELKDATADRQDHELVPRPEHKIFGLAMLGGGRVTGQAHLFDYPWAELGKATVVDIGGGVGGFCLQLSHLYPDLNFVIEDRAPVLEQAKTTVWPTENPSALNSGRVQFLPHDFFNPNPVQHADVYWMRYISHDWSDDYLADILANIRKAMGPNSRLLIADQVMNTTCGSQELKSAPKPLPANYGYFMRYSHHRDMSVMSVINGIQRTPSEFVDVVERAGLRLRKIWDCRSQVSIVEAVL